jgi:hypothetical protein
LEFDDLEAYKLMEGFQTMKDVEAFHKLALEEYLLLKMAYIG